MFYLLPLLAVALLVIGLPEAHTFRRPDYFRIGIIVIAVSLCLWIPGYFIKIDNQSLAEVLFLLLLFISGCALTAGIKLIRMADNKPQDDYWDNI